VRALLMPIAEKLRSEITLPINYPVLIIGDASSSMQVAVRVATIVAGFIASVCPEGQCNLRFFNGTTPSLRCDCMCRLNPLFIHNRWFIGSSFCSS
jgi:hypothetical protein